MINFFNLYMLSDGKRIGLSIYARLFGRRKRSIMFKKPSKTSRQSNFLANCQECGIPHSTPANYATDTCKNACIYAHTYTYSCVCIMLYTCTDAYIQSHKLISTCTLVCTYGFNNDNNNNSLLLKTKKKGICPNKGY